MSISRVVNNISALNASRNLDKTGKSIQKSIERLSSGLRINRASDDAAGMNVANRLRTQIQGLDQATTNASDGINLINVAEGSLDETTNRLNRIRTLSVQAANTAVNDGKARQAIQDEIFQNVDEISRIARTTQYGNNHLLNGDFGISTGTISGQEDIGMTVDASPVASTLKSGKSYLNIVKTQDGAAQIVAGDPVGGTQVLNTGIRNQTDIALSMAYFGFATDGLENMDGTKAALWGGTALDTNFFNSVSIDTTDIFVFEGVLSDGVTKFNGSLSVGPAHLFSDLASQIQTAMDDASKALFGLESSSSIPTSFKTSVSVIDGSYDNNGGRIIFSSSGDFINQASLNISLIRDGYIVTKSDGVARSGELGIESELTGQGAVGNSVTAITGSTFGTGEFDIEVYDVQSAQQRKVESTIAFRNGTGAVLDRTASMTGAGTTSSIVLNGSFVEGNYTGGVSLSTGDTITLRGINSDGTTFQGVYSYDQSDTSVDTTVNDFKFNSMSGLVMELNFRTRSYDSSVSGIDNGVQSRFEDAMFTFTANGSLMLLDDRAQSNSQSSFTLTFENAPTNTTNQFTFQDKANLVQEGFAEQATFRINGGDEVRAESGDVVTLKGAESTIEGVAQPEVTFRVGNDLTEGIDKLQNTSDQYVGSLNNGAKVTFAAGDQNVVFLDGNSGGSKGVSRFVTVDFDSKVDVTARTDGLPDAGRTVILSTNNSSLNFHIGAYADQNFQAAIGDISADSLGFGKGSGRTVADIDVTTGEGANEAIKIVDEALDQVNKTRSILGAATNRLESTISNLSVSSENFTASESRIRDADLAKETSEYTKNQVLMQAGISVLAQANFQSQGFLSLIG